MQSSVEVADLQEGRLAGGDPGLDDELAVRGDPVLAGEIQTADRPARPRAGFGVPDVDRRVLGPPAREDASRVGIERRSGGRQLRLEPRGGRRRVMIMVMRIPLLKHCNGVQMENIFLPVASLMAS